MLSRRWFDPFEEMRSIIDEMDRMMEEFWSTGIYLADQRAEA